MAVVGKSVVVSQCPKVFIYVHYDDDTASTSRLYSTKSSLSSHRLILGDSTVRTDLPIQSLYCDPLAPTFIVIQV